MESQDLVIGSSDGEAVDSVLSTDLSDIIWSLLSTSTSFIIIVFIITCIRVIIIGQKTRNPQQRRMYVGTRGRPSLGQTEPPIFVSPSNLPPPPKYECMAPPSYEEVVGVHYPNYPAQPITQPITTALAQSASNNTQNNENRNNNVPETVITVSTDATRTEVPVARS